MLISQLLQHHAHTTNATCHEPRFSWAIFCSAFFPAISAASGNSPHDSNSGCSSRAACGSHETRWGNVSRFCGFPWLIITEIFHGKIVWTSCKRTETYNFTYPQVSAAGKMPRPVFCHGVKLDAEFQALLTEAITRSSCTVVSHLGGSHQSPLIISLTVQDTPFPHFGRGHAHYGQTAQLEARKTKVR